MAICCGTSSMRYLSFNRTPSAQGHDSQKTSHDFKRQQNDDAGIEPGRPVAGSDQEYVIERRVEKMFVKIDADRGKEESERDRAANLLVEHRQRNCDAGV